MQKKEKDRNYSKHLQMAFKVNSKALGFTQLNVCAPTQSHNLSSYQEQMYRQDPLKLEEYITRFP